MTKDVNVILIDMPTGKNEVVTPNEDGSYTLFINSRLSYDGQLEAYKHGMNHIEHDDFDKYDADKIEYNAHNLQSEKSTNLELIPASQYEFKLKKLRQRRKQLEREMIETQERIQILQSYGHNFFHAAEQMKFYGNDLR